VKKIKQTIKHAINHENGGIVGEIAEMYICRAIHIKDIVPCERFKKLVTN
jgi:hypothetical protein